MAIIYQWKLERPFSELGFMIKPSSDSKIILDLAYKCTQEEAEKYPQFKWVALEELE